MSEQHKGIIAGLALGSFISMLLVLFSIVTGAIVASAVVPFAAFGVFLGAFAASLVTMTWATVPVTSHFSVMELA